MQLKLVNPSIVQHKLHEQLLFFGKERFCLADIRVHVRCRGYVSQIYAIWQAFSKSLVSPCGGIWSTFRSRTSIGSTPSVTSRLVLAYDKHVPSSERRASPGNVQLCRVHL